MKQETASPSRIQLDANRQAYLEYLYDQDGRHDPTHAMHSLYTGLAVAREGVLGIQQFELVLSAMGRTALDAEIRRFHEDPQNAIYFEELGHGHGRQQAGPVAADPGA